MNRIVLDAATRAQFEGRKVGAELVDENGNVLGHYLPPDSFDRLAELLLPPPTKKDLAEARKEMLEKGGVSTAEILEAIASAKREWEARR